MDGGGTRGASANSISLSASDTSSISAIAGAAAVAAGFGGDAGIAVSIGISLAFNKIANQVEAYLAGSGAAKFVTTTGGITIEATENAGIRAVSAAASVAVGAGTFGAGVAGAGAYARNEIYTKTNAGIESSIVESPNGDVWLHASDTSTIKALIAAVALGVGAGAGGLGVAIGVSFAENVIGTTSGFDYISDQTSRPASRTARPFASPRAAMPATSTATSARRSPARSISGPRTTPTRTTGSYRYREWRAGLRRRLERHGEGAHDLGDDDADDRRARPRRLRVDRRRRRRLRPRRLGLGRAQHHRGARGGLHLRRRHRFDRDHCRQHRDHRERHFDDQRDRRCRLDRRVDRRRLRRRRRGRRRARLEHDRERSVGLHRERGHEGQGDDVDRDHASATEGATIDAWTVAASLSIAVGAVGAGISGAGAAATNVILTKVNAHIDDSVVESAGPVNATAMNTANIEAKVFAVAAAVGAGGAGLGVAIGVSVARNFIGWDPSGGPTYTCTAPNCYASTATTSSITAGKRVKVVTGARTGDVYEYVGTTTLTNADLTVQEYGDASLWKQVLVSPNAAEVQAYVLRSSVTATGQLKLEATSSQTIDAIVVAGAVALSGGGAGVSVSGAGVFVENKIATAVKAFVNGDGALGISAHDILITADDSSSIRSIAGAASIAASIGAVGVAVSIGLAIAFNEVSDDVEASSGTPTRRSRRRTARSRCRPPRTARPASPQRGHRRAARQRRERRAGRSGHLRPPTRRRRRSRRQVAPHRDRQRLPDRRQRAPVRVRVHDRLRHEDAEEGRHRQARLRLRGRHGHGRPRLPLHRHEWLSRNLGAQNYATSPWERVLPTVNALSDGTGRSSAAPTSTSSPTTTTS